MAQDFGTPIAPPPPSYQEPKKSNTTLIIIIVVVLLLLCCCCGVLAWAGWTFGDAFLQSFGIRF
jgi:hypothetical protein